MSNLLPWLTKRRELFYSGEALKVNIASFLRMVDDGAKVREFPEAIIVLEDYGLSGNVRAWLLFDKFSRGVVRAMKKVADETKQISVYASTHDPRIRDVLVGIGFVQYDKDPSDFWLVKQGEKNGL